MTAPQPPQPPPACTLSDVLAALDLEQVNAEFFVGAQLDTLGHHIFGSHIVAQTLMAASRTVSQRAVHSLHTYFLRRGDSRRPVDFEVTALHDGNTFAMRRVIARQSGATLLEAMASFSAPVDSFGYQDYQEPMPEAPDPESLPPVQEQLDPYADELGGWWVRPQPFEIRYADAPPRLALEPAARRPGSRIRTWWRPNGSIPPDAVLHSCVLAYVSALTLLEPAMIARRTTPIGPGLSALIDHAVWFHRPADLSDWVLYDQYSPTGVGGRGLATGTMFNRAGQLVCTATQEGYFGRTAARQ